MKERETLSFVGPLGVGAALAYYLDPDAGGRRRSLLHGRSLAALHSSERMLRASIRDLAHRAQGMLARLRSRLLPAPVPAPVLVQRVRSALGRHVSHPHSVEVTAEGGHIVLSGVILAHEHEQVMRLMHRIPGVVSFETRLELHKKAGHVPGLQGGVKRPGNRLDIFHDHWAPSTRLLVGIGSAIATFRGMRRGGIFGAALVAGGALCLARAMLNVRIGAIVGVGRHEPQQLRKTINIAAPVEMVFLFWSNFENFARLLTHVRDVRVSDSGLVSHWTVDGPAGLPLHWDAELTRFESNRIIAWRSTPGAAIPNAGRIRFRAERGRTRVDIDFSYDPPAGALGILAARIFGADAKGRLEEGLSQIKTFLEQGPSERQARGLH